MSMSKDEKIQKIIDKIEKHLKKIKDLCKTETIPTADVKSLQSVSKTVNTVVENLQDKPMTFSMRSAVRRGTRKTVKRGTRKTTRKTVKKSVRKNSYTAFVQKHMKDKDLKDLPVTERMSIIAEMWRSSK